jgi:hypothetical protein
MTEHDVTQNPISESLLKSWQSAIVLGQIVYHFFLHVPMCILLGVKVEQLSVQIYIHLHTHICIHVQDTPGTCLACGPTNVQTTVRSSHVCTNITKCYTDLVTEARKLTMVLCMSVLTHSGTLGARAMKVPLFTGHCWCTCHIDQANMSSWLLALLSMSKILKDL